MSEDESGTTPIGVVLANSYEITRFIGRGGMGAVYEGRHMRLGQRVAIKIMAGDLAANREALVRFRREAEVTSRIRHPHIVHVFDFGSARTGEPFLVMEYLDGEDLEHRLNRDGRVSVSAAVHIVKQAAAALGAAHAKGVVHRDLKPANVFLLELEGEADFVKIVDFGISKVRAAATKLTQSAVIMGTPDYMSPEQARGRSDEIDHRTDQWALAAMTYEMLSGRSPFAGEDVASVLYQVTREEPRPLSKVVRGLPLELERVVHRALSKRPSDRFASVAAFARALEDAAANADSDERQIAARAPARSSLKATVAYGASGLGTEAPTLRGGRHEDADATIVSAAPAMTGQDAKQTTFSHATGEARLGFKWGRLARERRRMLVGAGSLAVGVAIWAAVHSSSRPAGEQTPTIKQLGAPSAAALTRTPVISPLSRLSLPHSSVRLFRHPRSWRGPRRSPLLASSA